MKEIHNKLLDKSLVFILLAIIPLVRINKTLDPNLHIQFSLASLFLLVYWLFIIFRKKELSNTNSKVLLFLLIFAAFIIYSIISLSISTNTPDAIFFFSKHLLSFILIFTFTFFLNPSRLFDFFARALIVMSTVALIPGYLQFFELLSEKQLVIPISTYNIFSVFAHRNQFSEILMFVIPVSIYLYFNEKRVWKYIGIINFSFILLIVITMSNRATWLAIFACSGLILIIAIIDKKKLSIGKTGKIFVINVIVICLISTTLFLSFSDTTTLKEHTVTSLDFKKGSTKDRIELWKRTKYLILEKPVLGHGLGSWKINMLKYGNKGLASEDNTTFYQRPHNDFLWVTAEQGVIGLLLYIAVFTIIFIFILKKLLTCTDGQLKAQLYITLCITLSYLIFSLLSFPKERIAHNIILYACWGIFLNFLNNESEANTSLPNIRIISPLILFLLIGIIVVGLYRMNSEIHTKNAILAKRRSNFHRCIKEIDKAKSIFYHIDETSTPISWYSGLSYFKLKDYQNSMEKLEVAYQLNPYHIYVLNDYASCLTKLNQNEKAIELYKKAISISPGFADVKLNLCALYYNSNNFFEAFDVLKSIDINITSEKYKKTVMVIIGKLIDIQLKTTQLNDQFIHQYQKEFSNYNFYRKILINAIKNDLKANEITNSINNKT